MEVENKLGEKHRIAAEALDLHWQRKQILRRVKFSNGKKLGPEVLDVWEWLWREARYRPRTIRLTMNEIAAALDKSRQAVEKNLKKLAELGIASVLGERGQGGGTDVAVEDPLEIFNDCPQLIEPSPQRDFDFAREEETEVDQEVGSEEPHVVAFDSAPIKCNPGDAQGCISSPEPKCNPETSQGCITNSERGDRDQLPAPLVALAHALGSDVCETWLGGCLYDWQSPELTLVFSSEFKAKAFRQANGRTLLEAGGEIVSEFRLRVQVESENFKCNPNATLWPSRVALGAQLTYQPTPLLEPSQGSNKLTNKTGPEEISETEKRGEALLAHAAEIYQRIGDPSLFKWIAIGIAILLDRKQAKPAQVDAAIKAYQDEGAGFPEQCFKRHHVWLRLRQVKFYADHNYGLRWRRKWDRGDEKPKQHERRFPK